jgi:DNA repair protein RadC
LGNLEREVFYVLFLNSQHQLIEQEALFFGTIDGAAVYPREIARQVIKYNAAAVILAHNHPSGTAEPSTADRRITERVVSALALIDVSVLDHFVVGGTNIVSFAEQGLL